MIYLIITLLLTLSYPTFSWAVVELDSDSNNAIDVAKGGTNATTATQAKINLGLDNVDNTSDAARLHMAALSRPEGLF